MKLNTEQSLDICARVGAPGEMLEFLKLTLHEPDADLTLGEMAELGAALSNMGATLTSAAKSGAGENIIGGVGKDATLIDGNAIFRWRNGGTSTILNSAEVKRAFPADEFPELYKVSRRQGSIAIELVGNTEAK